MLGSVALVAVWGEMADLVEFSPGIMHGLANPEAGDVELFSIDDLIGIIGPKVRERKLISANLVLILLPKIF